MTEVTAISAQATALLLHYGFDLGGSKAEKLAQDWLTKYPHFWLPLAVIEALYQGRYKAVSVEQILSMWQRLGQPLYHFNGEFERLVCNNFPQDLTVESDAKQVQEKIFLPAAESDVSVPELDLLPPPEVESDRVQDPEVPEIETEETAESSAVNPTGETAEVVIYEEDLAVTEVADKAEADREIAEKSVEKIAPIVKYTDFHSKLTAIAREGNPPVAPPPPRPPKGGMGEGGNGGRKKGERRKKS